MSDGSEAKKHAPSETKLRKQREKGSVASSQESAGFLACGLAIAMIAGTAGVIWQKMQSMITTSIDQIDLPFDEARKVSYDALGGLTLGVLLPILGLSLGVGFLTAIIYNKGFLFSMKPVTPQMSRVSPSSGFKRIYGQRGLIETPVSALRIFLWLAFAGLLGFWPVIRLAGDWACESHCWANQLGPLFLLLVIGAVVLMLLTAGADMLIQRKIFLHEQKMTDTERKNERKDQFGSPEVRQERRRVMREIGQPRRKPKVRNATMCFFHGEEAVAIEFRPPEVTVPYVMVRTRTAAESLRLRKRIMKNRWPELEHEGLTRAGLTVAPGDPLGEHSYSDFVEAVQKMFVT
ncbi:MAG: EscU/YscU/HrcU family type III secretion system export apparatus switch protein [Tabrizicola sp.]|nr:EscU/YscU/HrcU family type III secretion system export apparatus switch protein [Tabrizicola sp.]